MATATTTNGQTGMRDDQTVVEFDVRTDEMLVNMGPQHPSTHGVLRLVLRTDGEMISEVTPHLGYLHRCAEKIGENVTPIQFIPYTDRMDYLAAMNMNLGYSMAVEKLCAMRVPPKGQVVRVIIAEMGRIASHLVGMGAYGLDLGTFSPFLYAFREREMILDLFEEVCGARLTYSYITIGGVHDDLPPGWVERCRKFLDYFKPRIEEYHTLLTRNHIFIKRTASIGNLSKEEVPSVSSVWKTADWHEREVYDLSGVWFTGHPELRRILLSDDWEGHPLRKDYEFPLEYHGIRGR